MQDSVPVWTENAVANTVSMIEADVTVTVSGMSQSGSRTASSASCVMPAGQLERDMRGHARRREWVGRTSAGLASTPRMGASSARARR